MTSRHDQSLQRVRLVGIDFGSDLVKQTEGVAKEVPSAAESFYDAKRAAAARLIEALHPGSTSADHPESPQERPPEETDQPEPQPEFDGGVRDPEPTPPQGHDEWLIEQMCGCEL
jgi:hypothetical protein